jgi:hypothetical protein
LEKGDPARLKVDLGQRNGKISSFLEQYRMDKIRDLTPSRKPSSAASSPTAWQPATRRPRWRR